MILAPMEDVTDVVFREIVMECGKPDLFFTEFTNSEGLLSPGRVMVAQRLQYRQEEKPIIAQIWGKTPEAYFKAALDLVEMGFNGVDINFGCPVKKIIKQGACSALIDNSSLAGELIAATKEGTGGKIPVSVKTRMGFKTKKTEEWTRFLLEQDIAALTMHGRLSKDMSTKPADWDEIKIAVDIRNEMGVETKIIGNGDVLSLEQANEYVEKYGVDGIMIGRGIFQDPFLFNPEKSIHDLTPEQRIELMWKHAKLFTDTWGTTKNFAILKRFFKIYIRDFDGAGELRGKLMECASIEELNNLFEDN